MALLRLANGGDLSVKLTVDEVLARLGEHEDRGWIEFPGKEGPVHVRSAGVLAVIDSGEDRKQAGFFHTS